MYETKIKRNDRADCNSYTIYYEFPIRKRLLHLQKLNIDKYELLLIYLPLEESKAYGQNLDFEEHDDRKLFAKRLLRISGQYHRTPPNKRWVGAHVRSTKRGVLTTLHFNPPSLSL